MSIEGMSQAWLSYSEGVGNFYEIAGPILSGGEPLAPDVFEGNSLREALDGALAASLRIRLGAAGPLAGSRRESYERIARMLLAAAAVDAMVACDLAALDPYRAGAYRGGPGLGEADAETIQGERFETIRRAGAEFEQLGKAFPAGAGEGGVDGGGAQLILDVSATLRALQRDAGKPARRFVGNLLSIGLGEAVTLVLAVTHVDLMARLQHAASIIGRHAPGFLREHLAKLLALGAEGAEEATKELVESAPQAVLWRAPIEAVLAKIAAVERGREHVETVINATPVLPPDGVVELKRDLTTLGHNFQAQMELLEKSAKWLGRGGSLLSHLVSLALPGAGVAVVCGVHAIGGGYVAYSLIDRVDARDLRIADRVEGVVPLVDRHLRPS